ncbi:MAG TPA: hypothetical protein PLD25_25475 [Chloroflexota bacterium]|nr:hypothetical protein [Chloroflexota bacterium]HUM70332.1 hypothetical protein [Chloroflexota bacterium]
MAALPSRLITSEMMQAGQKPTLFIGGACNIQTPDGPVRNPGRDPLAAWLDEMGLTYFDPQIHPSTHGRDYIWEIDGPREKQAREEAKLRIYEITPTTIAAISMMEIMDDARHGRVTIVWFNEGRTFAPPGLGTREEFTSNALWQQKVGKTAYAHLLAYINAGRQLRGEIASLLADSPHITFVDSLDELKAIIFSLRHWLRYDKFSPSPTANSRK